MPASFSLGCSQTIGQYLLPKFAAGFLHTAPNVRITARSGNSEAMLEALIAREIALALIGNSQETRDEEHNP
jgi:DNA-binding transcriptional LysR family regulator